MARISVARLRASAIVVLYGTASLIAVPVAFLAAFEIPRSGIFAWTSTQQDAAAAVALAVATTFSSFRRRGRNADDWVVALNLAPILVLVICASLPSADLFSFRLSAALTSLTIGLVGITGIRYRLALLLILSGSIIALTAQLRFLIINSHRGVLPLILPWLFR